MSSDDPEDSGGIAGGFDGPTAVHRFSQSVWEIVRASRRLSIVSGNYPGVGNLLEDSFRVIRLVVTRGGCQCYDEDANEKGIQ